jgi:hypothetical protein
MRKPILRIFISATYTNLKQERFELMKSVLRQGDIPFGMELFPSSSNSVCDIIEKQVKECDIYALMIRNRYGSAKPETDISYTEWEYNLAVEAKKPIVVFISTECEPIIDSINSNKFTKFCEKVKDKHTITYFENNIELVRNFGNAIQNTSDENPMIGLWPTSNLPHVVLNIMNTIHPSFQHYILEDFESRNSSNIEEEENEQTVDISHNLLDYWQKYLYSATKSKRKFDNCVKNLAEAGYNPEADMTDCIKEFSVNALFEIFSALELIEENYEPTELGIYIGEKISEFKIKNAIQRKAFLDKRRNDRATH